jgi:hypothetical protein
MAAAVVAVAPAAVVAVATAAVVEAVVDAEAAIAGDACGRHGR